jgi:hypothetical protein
LLPSLIAQIRSDILIESIKFKEAGGLLPPCYWGWKFLVRTKFSAKRMFLEKRAREKYNI